MSKLSCISLEHAAAELPEVSGGEFVAQHLSLMPPPFAIDGEDPVSEEALEDVVVERPLQVEVEKLTFFSISASLYRAIVATACGPEPN